MLELDKKMVELLKQGVTLQKLQSEFDLCPSDLTKKVHGLEDKGYLITRIFYEYGVKFQILDKPLTTLQDKVEIISDNKFTFLVISDTHIGNIYENIELINKVYEYALTNDIRYVFHLGDMIEGISADDRFGSHSRIKREGAHEQVDFLTKNYPKKDGIDTLYILGNHDYRCLREGIDISRVIENRRLDMHFLGYQNSRIKIGNRDVLLHHPFRIVKERKHDEELKDLYFNPEFDLILRGHTHTNGIYFNDMGSLVVNVPACYSSPTRPYIGAYEVTMKNDNLELQSLIIGDEVTPFSSFKHNLKPKELIKTRQDQITKFNNRQDKAKK